MSSCTPNTYSTYYNTHCNIPKHFIQIKYVPVTICNNSKLANLFNTFQEHEALQLLSLSAQCSVPVLAVKWCAGNCYTFGPLQSYCHNRNHLQGQINCISLSSSSSSSSYFAKVSLFKCSVRETHQTLAMLCAIR